MNVKDFRMNKDCLQLNEARSPLRIPLMNSGFGLDLCASIIPFAALANMYSIAEINDIGFDSDPSIATYLEFSSLGKREVGDGNISSLTQDRYVNSLNAGTSLSGMDRTATSKHTKPESRLLARLRAEPFIDVPANVLHYGQLTRYTPRASNCNEASKSVKLTSRRVYSRNIRQLALGDKAASASKPSNVLACETCVLPMVRGEHLTKKSMAQLKQPKTLLDDQKRKLFLEKNRVAAANCRVKRQRREKELQIRSRELVSSNSALRKVLLEMSQEVQQLRSTLSVHLLGQDYQTATNFSEAFSEQAVDDRFCQIDLCNNDRLEARESLHQGSFGSEFRDEQDMSLENGYLQALSPLNSFSPVWECVSPRPEFIADLDFH